MIIMKQNEVHIGTKIWTCQTKILHSVLTYIPAWNFKHKQKCKLVILRNSVLFLHHFFPITEQSWCISSAVLIQEHVAPQNWRPQICLKWVWMARALKSMLSQPECSYSWVSRTKSFPGSPDHVLKGQKGPHACLQVTSHHPDYSWKLIGIPV